MNVIPAEVEIGRQSEVKALHCLTLCCPTQTTAVDVKTTGIIRIVPRCHHVVPFRIVVGIGREKLNNWNIVLRDTKNNLAVDQTNKDRGSIIGSRLVRGTFSTDASEKSIRCFIAIIRIGSISTRTSSLEPKADSPHVTAPATGGRNQGIHISRCASLRTKAKPSICIGKSLETI